MASQIKFCRECHKIIKRQSDHAQGCRFPPWGIINLPSVYGSQLKTRFAIEFDKPLRVFLGGDWKTPIKGTEMSCFMADCFIRFESNNNFLVKTTDFTRIRIPIVFKYLEGDSIFYKEKLVFVTSIDRTLMAARANRDYNPNDDIEPGLSQSTVLVIGLKACVPNIKISINVSGKSEQFEISFNETTQKFDIPGDIDMTVSQFTRRPFGPWIEMLSADPGILKMIFSFARQYKFLIRPFFFNCLFQI